CAAAALPRTGARAARRGQRLRAVADSRSVACVPAPRGRQAVSPASVGTRVSVRLQDPEEVCPMSHHFIVPTNENGVFLDHTINSDIQTAMDPVFAFADVFIYSHGWWTDAIRTMEGYNRFTIEFSRYFRALTGLQALPTLNIGVHWPST